MGKILTIWNKIWKGIYICCSKFISKKVFINYNEFISTIEYLSAWAKVKLRADQNDIDTYYIDKSYY